jgi:outer membrane immunogenic protein
MEQLAVLRQRRRRLGERPLQRIDALATYDFEGLETRFGWTAGAGVEWTFWNDWSVKLEYDYYGFGTRGVTFIDNVSATVGPLDIKQNIQVVKLGVNLHIFSGPGWPVGWW